MRGAVGLALVAACWTGDPPPPAAPRPRPAARVVRHEATFVPEQTQAGQLAADLRDRGSAVMLTLVFGPIVVGDATAGTVTTLCGTSADQLARDLGRKLSDPTRFSPRCMRDSPRNEIVCAQRDGSEIVQLLIENPEQPRLAGVFLVNRAVRGAPIWHQYQAVLAAPTCPP